MFCSTPNFRRCCNQKIVYTHTSTGIQLVKRIIGAKLSHFTLLISSMCIFFFWILKKILIFYPSSRVQFTNSVQQRSFNRSIRVCSIILNYIKYNLLTLTNLTLMSPWLNKYTFCVSAELCGCCYLVLEVADMLYVVVSLLGSTYRFISYSSYWINELYTFYLLRFMSIPG